MSCGFGGRGVGCIGVEKLAKGLVGVTWEGVDVNGMLAKRLSGGE